MKAMITLFTLLTGFGFGSTAHAFPWSCDLLATPDESSFCALNGRMSRQVSVGLHYGSISAETLVIEVLRADVTQGKLEQLKSGIKIDLATTRRTDDGRSGFLELEGRIQEDRLVFEIEDYNISTFYISEVRISAKDGYSLDQTVKSIFGPRALLVISAKLRERVQVEDSR